MSSEGISFNHSFISDLSRVSASPSSTSDTEDEDDPFIVERIEKKRFKVQYEYFVKWLGYYSHGILLCVDC